MTHLMLNKAQNNTDNEDETTMANDAEGNVVVVVPSSHLYGSSGVIPEAHRHSYDPIVLWHFVCPLQWCPYFPPFTKHSSTSEINLQYQVNHR